MTTKYLISHALLFIQRISYKANNFTNCANPNYFNFP